LHLDSTYIQFKHALIVDSF